MNKIVKRVMTMFGAGVMALSLLAPVTEVSAATKNQVVEIPVNFTNVGWEDLDKCEGNASKTDFNIWNLGVPQADDIETDITKSQTVAPDFWISAQGVNLTAKNCAIYFDDFKLTKADGTVLVSKDFTSDKKVEGDYHIAPVSDWDKESKELKLATITDNKVLTVKSTKSTVKVGKKVMISATATPAIKITYASSNKKVATVDAKGTVTGKKAGKAVISVKANGKTVKVTVTVKK